MCNLIKIIKDFSKKDKKQQDTLDYKILPELIEYEKDTKEETLASNKMYSDFCVVLGEFYSVKAGRGSKEHLKERYGSLLRNYWDCVPRETWHLFEQLFVTDNSLTSGKLGYAINKIIEDKIMNDANNEKEQVSLL
jgi:hypothetical protein